MMVNRLSEGGAKVSLTKPEAGSRALRDRQRQAGGVEQGRRRFRCPPRWQMRRQDR